MLERNKYKEQYESLLKNFESQTEQVKILRTSLEEIEARINDAKRKKGNIIAQDRVNKANEKVTKVLSTASKANIYDSLNRMEEKVNASKRKIESLHELEKDNMEAKFEHYDKKPVDDDLEVLKLEVFGNNNDKDGE